MTPVKADLHMHSTVSDGTDTPLQLLELVRSQQLQVFSITDHDAVAGCLELEKQKGAGGPLLIRGVEISTRDSLGKYHILGYGYSDCDKNGEKSPICRLVDSTHAIRMKKVRARLQFLEEAFGMRFSPEETDELLSLYNPGKPHIANLMIKHGYAETRKEAIRDFINKKKFPNSHVPPEEAIDAILNSGGIPVLAHAAYGDGSSDDLFLGDELEERVHRLVGMGLKGIEAYYSLFSGKMISEHLKLADKFDLYVTAGSDYHGSNKPNMLGDVGAEIGEAPPGMKRFFEDVAKF